MTPEFDALLSQIGSSRMPYIRTAITGLSAARTIGDGNRIAGAERLTRAEIGASPLTPAQKAAILAGCNLASPRRSVAAPITIPPRVAMPLPRATPAIPPMQRPTDGGDVIALIGAVGLAGFNVDAVAKTWTYTREVVADGGDVLELIQRVGLRGFKAQES